MFNERLIKLFKLKENMSGTIVIESHKDPVQCDSKDKPINFGVINVSSLILLTAN